MLEFFKSIDRRWIFLLMGLAVVMPIVLEAQFPERPTALGEAVFYEVDRLRSGTDEEPGAQVLLAFDFDPGSEGELGPMATAFVRHCAEKRLRMYFIALWPIGPDMIRENINKVIRADYPHLEYGIDYVNLGYKAGGEVVIKTLLTNLRQLYTTDADGMPVDEIPMMQGVANIRQMDLIINVSAGAPGSKEWVQYAASAYPDDIRLVAGCTGVQAPLLYPYIPQQLPGLLGAIKGAAEYEALVNAKYPFPSPETEGKYSEGIRRMGPQLVAHLLIIALIVAANVIFFAERRLEKRA